MLFVILPLEADNTAVLNWFRGDSPPAPKRDNKAALREPIKMQ